MNYASQEEETGQEDCQESSGTKAKKDLRVRPLRDGGYHIQERNWRHSFAVLWRVDEAQETQEEMKHLLELF